MNLETLHKVSYGIYIVSSKMDGKFNGQIVNTVFQITSEPPTIAVSINKQNLTHQYIGNCNAFTVSILSKNTPLKFIGLFGFKSGRDVDKFENINYKIGKTGIPIVTDNTIGYLEAEVINRLDAGTHTVFTGKVADAEILKDGEPMTYAYYHEIKGGTSPKTAPTYIKEEMVPSPSPSPTSGEGYREGERVFMSTRQKYKCTVCGYIYEPEKGDPDSGVQPGTPFEKLPDDWVCPVCGAAKDKFEEEK